jgi:hypothetical protein
MRARRPFSGASNSELPVQSAMLLLRQCAVPKMGYLLRCTPPPCIRQQAEAFDHQVLEAGAMNKLRLDEQERTDKTRRLLRAQLRHGGFGLTSAIQTSPRAYLGSLAAVREAPSLAPYCNPSYSLPISSQLHGWIEGCMKTITATTPESTSSLPSSPSAFFHHYSTSSISLANTLQSTLSAQANSHQFQATLNAAKEARRQGDGKELAHLTTITAPRAAVWKTVVPSEGMLRLSDSHYKLAARLNLGLQPQAKEAVDRPDSCPLCEKEGAFALDKWHLLSCVQGGQKALNLRHGEVMEALNCTVLQLGAQSEKEPRGLHSTDNRRPDLQLFFPNQHIITDVVVSHPLTPGYIENRLACRTLGVAKHREQRKHTKYDQTADDSEQYCYHLQLNHVEVLHQMHSCC